MAQKFDYPRTEKELRDIQDKMYEISLRAVNNNEKPAFKGLIEIISSEPVIQTAIHNIKSNKGSETPGTDGETISINVLINEYEDVIGRIKEAFNHYTPIPIRRTWIPKENKNESRALGIPTVNSYCTPPKFHFEYNLVIA